MLFIFSSAAVLVFLILCCGSKFKYNELVISLFVSIFICALSIVLAPSYKNHLYIYYIKDNTIYLNKPYKFTIITENTNFPTTVSVSYKNDLAVYGDGEPSYLQIYQVPNAWNLVFPFVDHPKLHINKDTKWVVK